MDPNQPVTPPPSEAEAPSSFLSRATDVFSAPGELYEEVATVPHQTSSWLLPYVLTILAYTVFTIVIFGNDSLRHQALEPRIQEMQKQFEEGRMTQEQYDTATRFMESPRMFLTFGLLGSLFYITGAVFGIPLILWMIARLALKARTDYRKMLEVYGLGSLIGILGVIVTMLLMHLFDSIRAVPGLGLVIMDSFDYGSVAHRFLMAIGFFSVWQTVVVGIGLAKVSGRALGTGVSVTLGLWLVWTIFASATGFGTM